MKINLDIIAEELSALSPRRAGRQKSDTAKHNLQGAGLYEPQTTLSPEICYAVSTDTITETFFCPSGITLAVIGNADEDMLNAFDADILVLNAENAHCTFSDMFNALNSVFLKYQAIHARLTSAVMKNAPLQEILKIGEELFGNPLILFDKNYCILGEADSRLKKLELVCDKWSDSKMLSIDMVNAIKTSPEYRRSSASSDICFVSDEYFAYNTLFVPVEGNTSPLTAAVMETERPLTLVHRQLALYFAGILRLALGRNHLSSGHSLRFEDFLKELLYDTQIEQAVIDRYLLAMNWKNGDNYLLVTFQTNRFDKINSIYNNICVNIEKRLRRALPFILRTTCSLSSIWTTHVYQRRMRSISSLFSSGKGCFTPASVTSSLISALFPAIISRHWELWRWVKNIAPMNGAMILRTMCCIILCITAQAGLTEDICAIPV